MSLSSILHPLSSILLALAIIWLPLTLSWPRLYRLAPSVLRRRYYGGVQAAQTNASSRVLSGLAPSVPRRRKSKVRTHKVVAPPGLLDTKPVPSGAEGAEGVELLDAAGYPLEREGRLIRFRKLFVCLTPVLPQDPLKPGMFPMCCLVQDL